MSRHQNPLSGAMAILARAFSMGCLGCALLPLFGMALLLGTAFVFRIPMYWDYSPLGWRIAADDKRLNMARDYLATRDVRLLMLADVRADLGEPTWMADYWSYAISENGLGEPAKWGNPPSHRREPALFAKFSRKGLFQYFEATDIPCDPARVVSFDAEGWKSLPRPARLPMACDLIESQPLGGASKEQMRATLGEPDVGEMKLEYHVGYEGGSDWAYLWVWLDANGHVLNACLSDE